MIAEAGLERTDAGLVPRGEGWFVVNAREALWREGDFGAFTRFEGEARFEQIGINLSLLWPGQPGCMYHGEDEQEDFLVLSGGCLLLVEGQERPLRAWDFVHCPPWTEHVFVGAGDGPCLILAVGGRAGGNVIYPSSDLARRHRACVEQERRTLATPTLASASTWASRIETAGYRAIVGVPLRPVHHRAATPQRRPSERLRPRAE